MSDNNETRKEIPIWGDLIPGNSPKSKTDILHIHPEYTMQDIFTKYPGIWDKTSETLGDMSGNDTLVYRQEIEHGPAKMTYEDVPFLVPYLVPESDRCVLICPGGAYLTKSMESEGRDIAAFLNEAGINAFVLWYRSYPYHAPYMFLDCQRAVRYIRFHAQEYGINPNKIASVGFSAGGNLNGVEALVYRNRPVTDEVKDYVPDEIDRTDANVNALGLIYPCVTLNVDKAAAAIAGVEVYNDPVRRKAFADPLELRTHIQKGDMPMFLCNTWDDDVLNPEFLTELALEAHRKGVQIELHQFPFGGHGFGGCVDEQMPQFAKDRSIVQQWKPLFANFINKVFA